MKKFYQTTSAKIYNRYNGSRSIGSLITVFYLIQYFKCKNILEIGYYEGQTFSLMLEASEPGACLTAIDPYFINEIYDQYYRDSDHTQDKTTNFLELTFEDFSSNEKYDFINIDSGVESLEQNPVDRYSHLIKSLDLVHDNSILMFDNYDYPPAYAESLGQFLKDQSRFVPFLMDGQAMYFHTINHDASDFLDNFLEKTIASQYSLYNQDYQGFTVKSISPYPVVLDDFSEILSDMLKVRNI